MSFRHIATRDEQATLGPMGAALTARPLLAVVVDAEEEFDWRKPLDRASRAVTSIPAQARAHEVFDPLGVVPTYVIDHPVAATPAAAKFIAGLVNDGRAEVGSQLHPWVNPPFEEEVNRYNSYLGNLSAELQRAKVEALTKAIEDGVGVRPTVFKAGRYGFGVDTARLLIEAGYTADCSFVPHADFSADGGPDYHGTPDRPFWLDAERRLLEVPLTTGFLGLLRGAGPRFQRLLDGSRSNSWRLPAMLGRAGIINRSRLTPEGVSAAEQKRLLAALRGDGMEIFTLAYHSPSLEPGHTPYVADEAELAEFLDSLRDVLTFFRDELGGAFTTISAIRDLPAMAARPVHVRS